MVKINVLCLTGRARGRTRLPAAVVRAYLKMRLVGAVLSPTYLRLTYSSNGVFIPPIIVAILEDEVSRGGSFPYGHEAI